MELADPEIRTILLGECDEFLRLVRQHAGFESRLEELATETKRDPTEITRALTVFLSIGKTRQAALRMMGESIGVDYNLREDQVERLNVTGTSSEVTEQLEAYIEAGVEHFAIAFGCPYDKVATQLETLGSEVLPHLSR